MTFTGVSKVNIRVNGTSIPTDRGIVALHIKQGSPATSRVWRDSFNVPGSSGGLSLTSPDRPVAPDELIISVEVAYTSGYALRNLGEHIYRAQSDPGLKLPVIQIDVPSPKVEGAMETVHFTVHSMTHDRNPEAFTTEFSFRGVAILAKDAVSDDLYGDLFK